MDETDRLGVRVVMSPEQPLKDEERSYASYLLQLRDDLDRTDVRAPGWRPASFCVVGGTPSLAILLTSGAPLEALVTVGALVLAPAVYLLRFEWVKRRERSAILSRIHRIEERRKAMGGE